jgi:hypothetical protein
MFDFLNPNNQKIRPKDLYYQIELLKGKGEKIHIAITFIHMINYWIINTYILSSRIILNFHPLSSLFSTYSLQVPRLVQTVPVGAGIIKMLLI